MSSLKKTPIKYSEYVEWFEKLEEIRKIWYAYFSDLAIKMDQYEKDWDPEFSPTLPIPNAIPTDSIALRDLANKFVTSLTSDSVFGEDYKENKVKKINDNKGIIIVRNNVDDETYYAGIANNITLSNSEKTYKVLIQNKGCDCMGFGINTDDTASLDEVWPSDSHSLTKCASKNTLSGYKWYKAQPLNTTNSALFGHSIIDLLQTIKNPQTVSAMVEANDKIEYDLEVKQLEVDYDINADIDLGTDPDLGTDVNLTTVLGRPIKYNIQAVFGLNVNYDLLKDKEISVDCSCNNSCVEDPIILLNKEKTAIIRQGLKVKGPYLITITPKLKHWKWASNLCFNIAANVVPIILNEIESCSGGCVQHFQQCTTQDITCCYSYYIYDDDVYDTPDGVPPQCGSRTTCVCDNNCKCECNSVPLATPSDCSFFQGYGCNSKTFSDTHVAYDIFPRHCAKSYVKTYNTELSCGFSTLNVTPTEINATGCKEENQSCSTTGYVKKNLCPVTITSPVVYVPKASYVAIQTAPLLTGIQYLYKMCVVDALSIIRGIVSLPGIMKTPSPSNLFFENTVDAPSSMVACDTGYTETSEYFTQDGGCKGISLAWYSANEALNLCCNTAINSADGTVSEQAPNLIIRNEPCNGYNTLKLSEDTQIRFKV